MYRNNTKNYRVATWQAPDSTWKVLGFERPKRVTKLGKPRGLNPHLPFKKIHLEEQTVQKFNSQIARYTQMRNL